MLQRAIPHYLTAAAARWPDKTAVVSNQDAVSFQNLHDASLVTAECLRELGVRPGDRVGVCMGKTIEQVYVLLGVLLANAVIVPILPRLKEQNIQHIIQNSGMAALVTDANRIGEVAKFSHLTKIITGHGEIDERWPNLPYMRRHIQARQQFDRIGQDNAAIIYSSGSTGRPKGILISHRNLADGAAIVSDYLGTREDDRICLPLSFNFDYGLNQLWQTILNGCTLYLHDFVLPTDLFSLLSEARITALPVMPVLITKMFDRRLYAASGSYDFSALRYVCSTGGRLSDQMLADLRSMFPTTKIYSMYGLTEAFRSTYLPANMLASRPTSIGKAIPDVQILVLDEQGRECPPNVPGVLVHRGGCVAKGYWGDPENTARVFRSHPDYPGETLVYSGDIVRRDEEGYLYFVGRKDEMIKTQGFRVSPTEVESEMLAHEDIAAAVAFGVANITVGDDIVCAYTTHSGGAIGERQLRQYLKENLPRHMVPTFLVHFENFPVTGNDGKIDRATVKASVSAQLSIPPEPRANDASASDTPASRAS